MEPFPPSADPPGAVVALPLGSPWPVVCAYPDGSFDRIGALPVPLEAIVRWDPVGRLWALDPVARTVTGYAVDGRDLRELVVHPMPRGFLAADMVVDDRRVYLGGGPRPVEATLFDPPIELDATDVVDLTDSSNLIDQGPAFEPMAWFRGALEGDGWAALPMPLGHDPNKAVDVLVLDGDDLVAVDDVVLPKWIFVFDRRPSGEPTHVRTVDLVQDIYETTHAGATVSSRWIALRSKGVGEGGTYRVVTLLARGTLDACGWFSTSWNAFGDGNWDEPTTPWASGDWGGAAFVGERLLVAALADGLLEVDCASLDVVATETGSESRGVDLTGDMRRTSFGDGSEVVDVVSVEAYGGAFVIVAMAGRRLAVWHPVTP